MVIHMADHAEAYDLQLSMTVSPQLVSPLRRFVEEVVEKFGCEPDLSARIAMAAHELLENVAKYGEERAGTVGLGRRRDGDGWRVVIAVSNQASPGRIARLKTAFHEMDAAKNPTLHYFSLMQREVPAGESGLGLARIRAEAEMGLEVEIVRDKVTIAAVSEVFAAAGAGSPTAVAASGVAA